MWATIECIQEFVLHPCVAWIQCREGGRWDTMGSCENVSWSHIVYQIKYLSFAWGVFISIRENASEIWEWKIATTCLEISKHSHFTCKKELTKDSKKSSINCILVKKQPHLNIDWTSTSCKVRDRTRCKNPTSWKQIELTIRSIRSTKIRVINWKRGSNHITKKMLKITTK